MQVWLDSTGNGGAAFNCGPAPRVAVGTGTSAWGFTCPNDGSGVSYGISAISVYVTSGAFSAGANTQPYTITLTRGSISGGVVRPSTGTPIASVTGTYPFAFSVSSNKKNKHS